MPKNSVKKCHMYILMFFVFTKSFHEKKDFLCVVCKKYKIRCLKKALHKTFADLFYT